MRGARLYVFTDFFCDRLYSGHLPVPKPDQPGWHCFFHLRFFSVSPLESGSLLVCDRVHHSQSFYFIGSGLAACSTSTCVRNSSGYLHVLKMGNSVRVPHSCLVDGRVFDTCCD